jgi:hypothetical protein
VLSILSYAERERLAYVVGRSDAPLLAELADYEARNENNEDAIAQLADLSALFPDEDFAQEVIRDLQVIAKRLRGDNRTDLLQAIEALGSLQTEIGNAAGEGVHLAAKIEKTLTV